MPKPAKKNKGREISKLKACCLGRGMRGGIYMGGAREKIGNSINGVLMEIETH